MSQTKGWKTWNDLTRPTYLKSTSTRWFGRTSKSAGISKTKGSDWMELASDSTVKRASASVYLSISILHFMYVWGREAGKEGMKWRDVPQGVAHIQSLNRGGGSLPFPTLWNIITQERKAVGQHGNDSSARYKLCRETVHRKSKCRDLSILWHGKWNYESFECW